MALRAAVERNPEMAVRTRGGRYDAYQLPIDIFVDEQGSGGNGHSGTVLLCSAFYYGLFRAAAKSGCGESNGEISPEKEQQSNSNLSKRLLSSKPACNTIAIAVR